MNRRLMLPTMDMPSTTHQDAAQQPSYFDEIANGLRMGSYDSMDEAWESELPKHFIKASPRHTGRGSGLLGLPTELRVMIYEELVGKRDDPWLRSCHETAFFAYRGKRDEIDVARFLCPGQIAKEEHLARRSWSWMLTHPTVLREGLRMVVETHPVVIRDLGSLRSMGEILERLRIVRLDLGRVNENTVRKVMEWLGKLPRLKTLRIRSSLSNLEHFRVAHGPKHYDFPCLDFVWLSCPELEAEDARLQVREREREREWNAQNRALEEEARAVKEQEQLARETPYSRDIDDMSKAQPVQEFQASVRRWLIRLKAMEKDRGVRAEERDLYNEHLSRLNRQRQLLCEDCEALKKVWSKHANRGGT